MQFTLLAYSKPHTYNRYLYCTARFARYNSIIITIWVFGRYEKCRTLHNLKHNLWLWLEIRDFYIYLKYYRNDNKTATPYLSTYTILMQIAISIDITTNRVKKFNFVFFFLFRNVNRNENISSGFGSFSRSMYYVVASWFFAA